jgi:hypothetical protein
MLIKIVDVALDVIFLTIYNLSKFRNYLTFRIPAVREADARLVAEWIEARQKRDALQAELNVPTISRLYDAQAKLLGTTKAAALKCQDVLVKLRAHRKG